MTPRPSWLLCAVSAIVLAGCGNSGDSTAPASDYVSESGAPVSVAQVFGETAPGGKDFRTFVSVERDGRSVVERGPIEPLLGDVPDPLFHVGLVPGSYTVEISQHVCDSSGCGAEPSGPAWIQCSGDFEAEGEKPVDIVAFVDTFSKSCEIKTGFVELG